MIRFILKQYSESDINNSENKQHMIINAMKDPNYEKYKFSLLLPCMTDNNNWSWLMQE